MYGAGKHMENKTIVISRILMSVYAATVCILCFMRLGNGIDMGSEWLGIPKDKIVHFFLFLPFPVLMYMAFHRHKGKPDRLVLFLLLSILIGAAAGAGIELLQMTTGYRSCDIMDFRADCIGLLCGSIAVMTYGAASRKW